MCHSNLRIKKWGSPSSFRRKRAVIFLNCSAFRENLLSSEGGRARARANHTKNDAQKGCAMQLKGITLRSAYQENHAQSNLISFNHSQEKALYIWFFKPCSDSRCPCSVLRHGQYTGHSLLLVPSKTLVTLPQHGHFLQG